MRQNVKQRIPEQMKVGGLDQGIKAGTWSRHFELANKL